jgi:putative membrane protein
VSAVRREPLVLLAAGLVALVVSGIGPRDRFTWVLEVAPVLLGVPLLLWSHRRFPLTPLLYRLLFVHALILMLGGHYTYAEVPPGFWVRDALGLARNHYDRLGHFAQGFVPAILAREILLRRTPLRRGGWLFFLVTSVCLAFSAFYELIEWWTAAATGEGATAFLGTQGDVWDTQWDMFLALLGALTAQLTLSRVHDRELDGVSRPSSAVAA